MKYLNCWALIVVAPFLSSCSGGIGTTSGMDMPSSVCKPYLSGGQVPVSNWMIERNSTSYYDIVLNISKDKLEKFKPINSGCSITSYQLSIVSGFKNIVFDTDPRPIVIGGWTTISASDSYTYKNLYLSSSYKVVSVCFRAFSNLGEESSWYCSSKDIPADGGGSPPTSPPTPPSSTDTTRPSTPSGLSISTIGTSVYLHFSSSSDAQSGIARYWTSILDSSMNVKTEKEISKYATSDSYNFSGLPKGQTYYYAIIAENGAGLYSPIGMKSFYIPADVSVTFRWEYERKYSCSSDSTILDCSQTRTMKDIDLLALKQNEYSSCTLKSLGGYAYDLDCRAAQTWSSVVQQPYCGGSYSARIDYNPVWVPHGISYVSGGCAVWSP